MNFALRGFRSKFCELISNIQKKFLKYSYITHQKTRLESLNSNLKTEFENIDNLMNRRPSKKPTKIVIFQGFPIIGDFGSKFLEQSL